MQNAEKSTRSGAEPDQKKLRSYGFDEDLILNVESLVESLRARIADDELV